jgi:hypothetical protein
MNIPADLLPIQSDLLNYAAFLGGQCLFLLKRAGSAMRNPGTNITRRRDYFRLNWDTAFIRAAMEFPFFYGYRHYGFAHLVSWMGWTPPSWFTVPDNPLISFLLGYAADSLLDWLSMSQKLPGWLRSWISENVPKLQGDKLQKTLDKAANAADLAAQAAKEAGTQVAKAQELVPDASATPAAPDTKP